MAEEFPNCEVIYRDSLMFAALLFNFDVAKTQMKPDHRSFLIKNLKDFKECADEGISASGSASSTGKRAFNQTLSNNRAKEVAQFLQHQLDVPAEKFTNGNRDKKTGEAVGVGYGQQGAPGVEDGKLRAVGVTVVRQGNFPTLPPPPPG
jgi:hypothetical protein